MAWVGVPYRDVFLAKALVLPVQEQGDDDLLALSREERAEMVGDSLRGFKSGGREFPCDQAFSELKRSLDLRDLCRPKAGDFEQVMNAGAIEPAKSTKILQN